MQNMPHNPQQLHLKSINYDIQQDIILNTNLSQQKQKNFQEEIQRSFQQNVNCQQIDEAKQLNFQQTIEEKPVQLENSQALFNNFIRKIGKKQIHIIQIDDDQEQSNRMPPAKDKISQVKRSKVPSKLQQETDRQLMDDLDIKIEDQDLKELQQCKTSAPPPQVFFQVLDYLSKLAPKYRLQHTLCALDRYFQNKDREDLNTTVNNTVNSSQTTCLPIPPSPIKFVPNSLKLQSSRYVYRHRMRFAVPGMTMGYRQQLQRKIAYIFIHKGYGLGLTRQALRKDIQNNLYNSLLTSIIRSSLRKMVDILNSNLKLHVEIFEPKQEVNMRSPLANCKNWMDANNQNTFYKIINILYSLQVKQLYPQEVTTLYYRICRYINKRYPPNLLTYRSGEPINLREQRLSYVELDRSEYNLPNPILQQNPQEKMNRQYQKEILHLFMKHGNIELIIEVLKLKYPSKNTTAETICSIIEKVIKLGLKRLNNSYLNLKTTKPKMPSLVLNDHIVRQMMRDRGNLRFRMSMLRFMNECSSSLNEQKLFNIIDFINEYINANNLNPQKRNNLPNNRMIEQVAKHKP